MTTTQPSRTRADGGPEFVHYRDTGCRLWHACLSCPFPRCAYDEPLGPRRTKHEARDAEIRRRHAAGESIATIAVSVGVVRRTVYRALGQRRGPPTGSGWIHRTHWDGSNEAEVLAAYQRGDEVRAICRQYGLSIDTLYARLHVAGIPLRGTRHLPGRRTAASPAPGSQDAPQSRQDGAGGLLRLSDDESGHLRERVRGSGGVR